MANNKIWKFVFFDFFRATDRGIFKAKMKRKGIKCSLLNVHNMMICAPEILDVIKESINEQTKISILDVKDEQFKKMEYYKGV